MPRCEAMIIFRTRHSCFYDHAGDFINFPSPSFLRGLSEVKPYLSKGETRSIALTIRVPLQEELGSRQ